MSRAIAARLIARHRAVVASLRDKFDGSLVVSLAVFRVRVALVPNPLRVVEPFHAEHRTIGGRRARVANAERQPIVKNNNKRAANRLN